jgi:hypothetical protein
VQSDPEVDRKQTRNVLAPGGAQSNVSALAIAFLNYLWRVWLSLNAAVLSVSPFQSIATRP